MAARGRTTLRAAVTVSVTLTVVAAFGLPPALAAYVVAASASNTVSTASLVPPTNPSVTGGTCTLAVADSAVVSWTATTSTWADGYEVLTSPVIDGIYTVAATVAGPATTTATVSPIVFLTTTYIEIRATKGAWRSAVTTPIIYQARSSACL